MAAVASSDQGHKQPPVGQTEASPSTDIEQTPHAGEVSTKERILRAAVEQFAQRGYNGASLRAIAADANADLALIAYYFGNKAGLFLTIVDQTLAPATRLLEPQGIPLDEVPEWLLNWIIDLFETSPARHTLIAVLRTVLTPSYPEDEVQVAVVQRLRDVIVGACGGPDSDPEVYAFSASMVGMITIRYVTPIEPVASVPRDELVEIMAPRLRRLIQKYGWMGSK